MSHPPRFHILRDFLALAEAADLVREESLANDQPFSDEDEPGGPNPLPSPPELTDPQPT
jgi:hypothetical protein